MEETALGLISGYGDGDGYGYGYGYGDGYGDGYGYGSGYGSGSGSGSGYGYGYGYGYGSGYGSGPGCEIALPESRAWQAVHYVKRSGDKFVLRDGRKVAIGETIVHQRELKMCVSGLHASFTGADAQTYRPEHGSLTRVEVWGRIRLHKDKIVATHRRIIAAAEEEA